MTPGYIAIVGAIATIIAGFGGAALGAWFASRSGMKLIQETNRITAAAKLHAAFAPAQVQLSLPRELGNVNVKKFFENEFLRQAKAVEEFRPFVNSNTTYQKAWDEYRRILCDPEADDFQDVELRWSSGMICSGDDSEPLDYLQFLNQKIAKILHFASVR